MIDDCALYRRFLAWDRAGELDGERRSALAAHLDRCGACRRFAAEIDETLDVLRGFEPAAPPAVVPLGPPAGARAAPRWTTARALAAALALAAVSLGAVAAAGGVHVRREAGVVLVSVGQAPQRRLLDSLEARVLERAARRDAQREERLVALVSAWIRAQEDRQQARLADAVRLEIDTYDRELRRRLAARERSLRADVGLALDAVVSRERAREEGLLRLEGTVREVARRNDRIAQAIAFLSDRPVGIAPGDSR